MKKDLLIVACGLLALNMSATVIKGNFSKNADLIYNVSVIPDDSLKCSAMQFSGYENEFEVNIGNIEGDVLVNVSSAGYSEYTKRFNKVDSASVLDLGHIQLERNHVLMKLW